MTINQALKTVKAILKQSELRELWEESSSFTTWQKNTEKLINQLFQVKTSPPIERERKKQGMPRNFAKIAALATNDENCRFRLKLVEKIHALKDIDLYDSTTDFCSPLVLAARYGLHREVELLLELGAEIEWPRGRDTLFGYTALDEAARYGQIRIAELLLERGASQFHYYIPDTNTGIGHQKVEQKPESGEYYTYSYPLRYAVRSGNIELVKICARYGAKLEEPDFNGETLLHIAAAYCQVNMIDYLASNGVDVNAQQHSGETPLHFAGQPRANWKSHKEQYLKDYQSTIKMLLKLGADPTIEDEYGCIALEDKNREIPQFMTRSHPLAGIN